MPATDMVLAEATPQLTLSALYPYDAAAYAPALGVIPAGTPTLWAVLRCSGAFAEAELAVSAALSAAANPPGIQVPVTVLKQTRNGTTKVLLVEFPSSDFAPGNYSLTFTIKESNGFLSGTTAVAFRIQ